MFAPRRVLARQSRGAETVIGLSAIPQSRDDPDFWSVVGLIELRMFEAVAARSLAGNAVLRDYDDVHRRVSDRQKWSSVYDSAKFVLRKYEERASDNEKTAAANITARLKDYAGLT